MTPPDQSREGEAEAKRQRAETIIRDILENHLPRVIEGLQKGYVDENQILVVYGSRGKSENFSRLGDEMKFDYRETPAGKRRFKYRCLYKLTVWFQAVLWRLGIPWHNSFSDECTPNFNCCVRPKYKYK